MPRLTAFLLVSFLGLFSRSNANQIPTLQHAADHILVKFKPAESLAQAENTTLSALAQRLNLPSGATLRHSRRNAAHITNSELTRYNDRFLYLSLPPGMSAEDCVRQLKNHPLLDYAEFDGFGSGGGIPNDPDFSLQWHHQNPSRPGADIHTPAAWDITTGSKDVTVAILDTGLNTALPEFAGRIVPGYDFVNNDTDPNDDNGHGTAVAGTLCATGNNGALVAGVDWNCKIMPLKVLNSANFGLYSDWADAIDFAVSNGCRVINLSAGGSSANQTLTRSITNAIGHGVIFVTITHNDSSGIIRFPARLPETIAIGSSNELDQRAGFSNYGPEIDLVAPGTNIWTVSRSGSLSRWWGTSFSGPQAAGVCTLMVAANPDITHEEARAFLTKGADDLVGDATDAEGFDPFYGWGRLNALSSVTLARAAFDTDLDGMPNRWEIAFGLDPNDPDDAVFDSDGDLVSNLLEFQSQTDPTDSNSVARITAIQVVGSDVRLGFRGTRGDTYEVQKRFGEADWKTILRLEVGTLQQLSIIDTGGAGDPMAFYRFTRIP